MTLATTYNVTTKYRVDEGQSRKKVDRLARKTDQLSKQVQKTKKRLKSFLAVGGAVAGGTLLLKLKQWGSRMLKLGKQTQVAKFELSGFFDQIIEGSDKMKRAEHRAEGLQRRLSDLALETPFKRGELRQFFKSVAPSLDRINPSDQEIQRLIRGGSTIGAKFTGGKLGQAGRDIGQILRGQAGLQNRTFRNLRPQLFSKFGVKSADELNKLAKNNPAEVFQGILEVGESFGKFLPVFQNSIAGLESALSTMRDQFLRWVFEALEPALEGPLQEIKNWFQRYEPQIRRFAHTVGETLAGAFDKLGEAAQFAVDNIGAIGGIGALLGGAAANQGIGRMLGLGGGVLQKTIGGAISSAFGGAVKSGGMLAAGLGAKKAAFALGFPGVGQAIATAEALKILGTAVNFLWKTVKLVAKGAAILSVIGAFRILKDELLGIESPIDKVASSGRNLVSNFSDIGALLFGMSQKMQNFQESLESIVVDQLFHNLDRLHHALNELARALGTGNIFEMLSTLSNRLGVTLLFAISNAVGGLAGFITALDTITQYTGEFLTVVGAMAPALEGIPGLAPVASSASAIRNTGQTLQSLFGKNELKPLRQFQEDTKLAGEKLRETLKNRGQDSGSDDGDDSPIDVTINQKIQTDADPDRIALRVEEVLGEALEGTRPNRASAPAF